MSARAQAVAIEYDDYEDPVEIVSEAPPVAEVDDSTFDDHEKICEVCHKAKHSLGDASTRGLARLTRDDGARRAASWRALCPEGKRLFVESWRAFGIGLPAYARERS